MVEFLRRNCRSVTFPSVVSNGSHRSTSRSSSSSRSATDFIPRWCFASSSEARSGSVAPSRTSQSLSTSPSWSRIANSVSSW
ncbi:hypothetical protein ACFQ1S_25730, partial [Kibdelosporangium lantanae]